MFEMKSTFFSTQSEKSATLVCANSLTSIFTPVKKEYTKGTSYRYTARLISFFCRHMSTKSTAVASSRNSSSMLSGNFGGVSRSKGDSFNPLPIPL
ncbi:hypothetical protein L3X38_018815 [Prunus dulcis]|uniref:Uncharacterized protein n=1 Tax=Prunus dulcis TaxID=3755 RepID=A0AAD4W9X7_PRUDU|nr:hypothetical protein L3X38_018815 [Prunus dulcis]